MKKTLVAVAALAVVGAASAQSSVTLSGIVKGGYASTKFSGGAAGNGSNRSFADGSSRFILSGREDLGGGMAGIFQIDTRFRVDDNGGGAGTAAPTTAVPSQLATGNTFVGVSGGFGSIRIGKLDTHYCTGSDEHGVRATALGASSCGILGYVGSVGNSIANASRSVNVVRYDLPSTMMAGVTGSVTYSSGFQANDGFIGGVASGDAWAASLGYTGGPLSLGFSMWRGESEDQTVATRFTQKAYTVFGKWNFGVGTIGLTYDRSSYDRPTVDNRRNAFSVPVTFGVGAGTILATYTRARGVSGIANSGASLMTIGYDHALSKRTSMGISYARMNNEAGASYQLYTVNGLQSLPTVVSGQDQRQLYLGLRHAF